MVSFLYADDVLPDELGTFLLAALVTVVIVILLVRADGDGDGRQSQVRYYSLVCVVTLFVTLFATFSAVRALTDLVVDHQDRVEQLDQAANDTSGYGYGSDALTTVPPAYAYQADNDGNYAAVVESGLVALTAGAVFVFHYRRRRALTDGADGGGRVERAYLLGVCFIAVLLAAYASARAAFGIFEIAAPGIATGRGEVGRAEGISHLLSYGLLAGAAFAIFRSGWTRGTAVAAARPAATRAPGARKAAARKTTARKSAR